MLFCYLSSRFLIEIEMTYARLLNISTESKHSVFLFGPRGTGKTSWLCSHFKNAVYYDLLDDDTYTRLLAWPKRIAEDLPADFSGWIIIDEIQKAPKLLDEVHRLIEHRQLKFILTGSSVRKLRQTGVNLLAGRAITLHMHPLTTLELGNDFNLSTALTYGLLPSIYSHENPAHYLASYVATYLREEVLQEGVTRNIALFTRFLETASFSQGEQINFTAIAREVGHNRHTIANFFDILDDLLIASRIYPFTKRAQRAIVSSPKFYYFDTGVYRSIRPLGPLDSREEIDGAALETLFLQQAKAINDYFQLNYDFFYWRTTSNIEVDFILYGENGFHAFEIKRKRNISKQDLKGLKTFKADYPEAHCYLLYGGNDAYIENGISICPYEQTLKSLKELLSPQKPGDLS